jgi:hypothetical protein
MSATVEGMESGSDERESSRPGEADIASVEACRAVLHALPGVVGVALGRSPVGEDVIDVYLSDASAVRSIPSHIEGHPIRTIVTGSIDAL